jgi:transcriptional regulator with XRE-family HTH domain
MAEELRTDLVSQEEAARFLGVSVGTLEQWRCRKTRNLPYVKLIPVKYRISDLNAFIEAHVSPGTPSTEKPRRKYRRRSK